MGAERDLGVVWDALETASTNCSLRRTVANTDSVLASTASVLASPGEKGGAGLLPHLRTGTILGH